MDSGALAELGMTMETDLSAETDASQVTGNDKDYFVEKDGVKFAGTHLLIELWGAKHLRDPAHIETALCDAATAASATILHSHFHHFSPDGVSGVVVLAESHISIHTWPERGFAAIDVFMCGGCDPFDSVPVIEERFGAERIEVSEHRRGLLK